MNSAARDLGEEHRMHKARSFLLLANRPGAATPRGLPESIDGFQALATPDRQFQLFYCLRDLAAAPSLRNSSQLARGTILLGDSSEWSSGAARDSSAGNGASVEYDLASKTLIVHASIVGLPPVFVFEDSEGVILTSDLHLLRHVAGLQLRFDLAAIRELGYVGHPIGFHTLFRDVSLLPGGTALRLDSTANLSRKTLWRFPQAEPATDWRAFLERQIAAASQALRGMDLSASFLSLTAGLDTRAILALLVELGRLLPAYTISGKSLSLDARTACRLAEAYRTKYEIVRCGDDFCRQLPFLVTEASRLSGGLASLGQAPQVFFYRSVGDAYLGRLSGYLGNQVGRGGTEKLSNRNADPAILDPELRRASDSFAQGHWFQQSAGHARTPGYEFLLQREVPFSSVGNYCVGNHFVIEQSPYTSRALIELLPERPRVAQGDEYVSVLQRRLSDLRHRFLGEPASHSFQRTLIARQGGAVASYPINWGWRAKGGVSVVGALTGLATFVDAIASSRGIEGGLFASPSGPSGLFGLHDYRQPKLWIDLYLKDLLFDLLTSRRVREISFFDRSAVQKLLDDHYSAKHKQYGALLYALDLALAQETFSATL